MKSIYLKEYKAIIDALVAERKKAGITQTELAHKLGKPQSFISKTENKERRLDIVEFFHICRAIEKNGVEILQAAGIC
ncbi:helix-turn-helix transcriptional regulator [Halodesulfovibrio sp.]|jgi:transcriptional regulator with XRE-family HTH domain|uniref:helix-turn-helix domain-containing protein n=1 Tax=Halodesulfovibrio sp. TaxID=1912772 RepID=UPI0025EF8E12|nr:helix-turn-helix transcriptional regulator [Halodesulfovibrio sp.]MCT4627319.1 helix-turn-helix domain-containing protein [Halodesulfovibrio sp.]